MSEEAQRPRTLIVPRTKGLNLDLAAVMEQAEAAGRAVGEPFPRPKEMPPTQSGEASPEAVPSSSGAVKAPIERRTAKADPADSARTEQRMTVHIPDSLVLATKKAALDAGISLSAYVARALEVATARS